ncbi:hypothetical protein CEJ63_23395, partial [Acinetobacter baumannii]
AGAGGVALPWLDDTTGTMREDPDSGWIWGVRGTSGPLAGGPADAGTADRWPQPGGGTGLLCKLRGAIDAAPTAGRPATAGCGFAGRATGPGGG